MRFPARPGLLDLVPLADLKLTDFATSGVTAGLDLTRG